MRRDAVFCAGRVADAEEQHAEEQVQQDGGAEARAQRALVARHALGVAHAQHHELRPQAGLLPHQLAAPEGGRRGELGRHDVGVELARGRLVVVADVAQPLLVEGLHQEHDVVGRVRLCGHGEAKDFEEGAQAAGGAVVERPALAEEEHAIEEVEDLRRWLVDGAEDGAAGPGEILEDVDHNVGGVGVEAARRLVQKED